MMVVSVFIRSEIIKIVYGNLLNVVLFYSELV